MEISLGWEKATGLKEEPGATFCALQTSCSNSSKQGHSRSYSRLFPYLGFQGSPPLRGGRAPEPYC